MSEVTARSAESGPIISGGPTPMYYLVPTDRQDLPDGLDWMMITEPCGDVRMLVARDADEIPVPPKLLCDLVTKIVDSAYSDKLTPPTPTEWRPRLVG